MSLLTQLQTERQKYQKALEDIYAQKAETEEGFQELQKVVSVAAVEEAAYIAEQSSGKRALLAHKPADAADVEEVILRVQGFVIDLNLPPVRTYSIPRNLNRLIDLKQSLSLTGLGVEGFDSAVRGVQNIHQAFANYLAKTGGRLRPWVPGQDQQDLTLTFSSRYLTSAQDAGNEPAADIAEIVDPFNVLRPLLCGEVHTLDNVVEYWERRKYKDGFDYDAVKPLMFSLTSLVEVQLGFMVVRVAKQEYAFIPKLRAICLFNRMVESDYNLSSICVLASGHLSPLKKVKRKIGYRATSSDDSGNDDPANIPNKQLKLLTLGKSAAEPQKPDVAMKELN